MNDPVVKIVSFEETTGKAIIKWNVLKRILGNQLLETFPILIYSISGRTGGGKSYLMNYFWHWLRTKFSKDNPPSPDEIPNIFSSTHKIGSETLGIDMTADPIFCFDKNGQKCAIFLMDTQGIEADKKSKPQEPDIFALSTLLSSFQIINVSKQINWDVIDTYAGYCTYAECQGAKDSKGNLLFLVRDWEYPAEYPFGCDGGKGYLKTKTDDLCDETKMFMHFYDYIDCSLLPPPGLNISECGSRKTSDIDPRARQKIEELFEYLTSPTVLDRLVSHSLTGRGMKLLLKNLKAPKNGSNVANLSSGCFEQIHSLCAKERMDFCLEMYKSQMESERSTHEKALKKALEALSQNRKSLKPYEEKLRKRIEKEFETQNLKKFLTDIESKVENEYNQGMGVLEMMESTFSKTKIKSTFDEVESALIRKLEKCIHDPAVLKEGVRKLSCEVKRQSEIKLNKADSNQRTALGVGIGALGGLAIGSVAIGFVAKGACTSKACLAAASSKTTATAAAVKTAPTTATLSTIDFQAWSVSRMLAPPQTYDAACRACTSVPGALAAANGLASGAVTGLGIGAALCTGALFAGSQNKSKSSH